LSVFLLVSGEYVDLTLQLPFCSSPCWVVVTFRSVIKLGQSQSTATLKQPHSRLAMNVPWSFLFCLGKNVFQQILLTRYFLCWVF